MLECDRCGSQLTREREAHECIPVPLRFMATRAYNEDVRRQRHHEHKLGGWVDLAINRIADGMDPREAVEIAVDCAFVHGQCARVKEEIEAVILGERRK